MLMQSGNFNGKKKASSTFYKSVGRVSKKIKNNSSKKPAFDVSKINFHGIIISKGPVKTVRAKDPDKTWSMDVRTYNMFIGDTSDVVVSFPSSSRNMDDPSTIFLHGSWDKKALKLIEQKYKEKNRLPHEDHTIQIQPRTFISVRCQDNPTIEVGDLIKVCNFNMNVLIKEDDGAERAFVGADSVMRLTKIPVSMLTN